MEGGCGKFRGSKCYFRHWWWWWYGGGGVTMLFPAFSKTSVEILFLWGRGGQLHLLSPPAPSPPSSSSDRINPYRIIYTIVTNEQAIQLTFSPLWFSSCRIPSSFSRSLSDVVAWINLASLSTFCGPPPLPFT